jgi:hypothetical protein
MKFSYGIIALASIAAPALAQLQNIPSCAVSLPPLQFDGFSIR